MKTLRIKKHVDLYISSFEFIGLVKNSSSVSLKIKNKLIMLRIYQDNSYHYHKKCVIKIHAHGNKITYNSWRLYR